MTKKDRTPVPPDIANKVMYDSRSTCCVCEERGKGVQIHHIDEDPSNHVVSNLAVLCLEHHDQAHTAGGFGRRLTPSLIRKYRDHWLAKVDSKRKSAESSAVTMPDTLSDLDFDELIEPFPFEAPLDYISVLPDIRRGMCKALEARLSEGITSKMRSACHDYIDQLQAILFKLASYYPQHHFDKKDNNYYFASLISSRFYWHRYRNEPGGMETGGTMIHAIVDGNVVADVEKMIEEMVEPMTMYSDNEFDYKSWLKKWRDSIVDS